MEQTIEEMLSDENIDVQKICELINSNNINKAEILSNDKFKEKIYNELNKSYFDYSSLRSLVNTFGAQSCIENMDIDKLMDNSNSYRFFVVLNEADSKIVLNTVANNEKYYNHFFKNIDSCFSILGDSNKEDVKNIIEKINNSGEVPDKFDNFISGVPTSSLKDIIKEDLNDEILVNIVKNSTSEIKQDFISNHPKAVYLYKNLNVEDLINKDIEFPKDILKQKAFFEKIKKQDLVDFRRNINRIYNKNYSFELEKRVKDYEDSIINEYNPETKMFNIYSKYLSRDKLEEMDMSKSDFVLDDSLKYDIHKYIDDEEKLKEVLQKATSEKLSSVVIDSMFSDTKNNVKINTNEMLRYNAQLSDNEKVLDNQNTQFYSNIKNIDELSSDEIVEMYKNSKENNNMAKLYSDMSALKKISYKKINESLYKVENNADDLSFDETQKNDTSTYKLNGKPFNMLVRRLGNGYREETNNVNSSYSLISNSNMKVFGSEGFLYGYDELDPNSVENAYESDSYSINTTEKNVSERPNRIMTPEELTAPDSGYSEINIKNKKNEKYDGITNMRKYKEMKPTYLVAMDKADPELVEESKRLNIPIVVIERERYKDKQINTRYEDEVRYDFDIN